MKQVLVCMAFAMVTFAGCVDMPDGPGTDASTAVICTNVGPITLDLHADKAPKTVANFVGLAESGYYDDVVFHRIITDFMMQGGDPTGTGSGGEAHGGGMIEDEFHPDLRHDRAGVVSMANRGPNTGSSQFFIVFEAPRYPTHLDDKHAIFAQVTDGMDVVDEIEANAGSQSGAPREDVFMHTVLVGQPASDCPPADGFPEPTPPVPAFACPLEPVRAIQQPVDGDLITPGVLCITHTEDRSLVWARHLAEGDVAVTWDLTGPEGTELPDGWVVSFDDEGGAMGDARGSQEATHTMMHVTVPEGTSGTFDLELQTGHGSTPIKAHVDLRHDRLTAKGDGATVEYSGRCASDGQTFDSGTFPLTLGGGRAITGFDLGLIGHGENEGVMIHIPAPLAYGYNGPVCAGDNADLIFDVSVTDF